MEPECRPRPPLVGRPAVPRAGSVRGLGTAPADGGVHPGAGTPLPAQGPADVDPGGLRPDPLRDRTQRRSVRRSHRHHLSRRHHLHQPGRVGEPPPVVCRRPPGRRVPHAEGRLPPKMGRSPGGAAHRDGDRRDQPLSHAGGARAVARAVRGAVATGRHRLRSVRRPRSRCPQLRLLPGCPLHAGGDAVRNHGSPPKGAPTSPSLGR